MAEVTAVTVTLNGLPWIEQCLESLPGVERIVVDHGSSDGTLDLVRERFPDVRVIEQENRGYGAGLNAGFSSNAARRCESAARTASISVCAAGVGDIPLGVRTNSGSSNVRRNRVKALLIAGWLNPTRFAARVTLRSSISASKASSRFRSIDCKFIA